MKLPFVRHHESNLVKLLDVAAIVFGIGLFIALTLPNVLNSSAYFDEGYSAYLAKFDPLTIAGYTALDVHPPLYYSLLHIWQGIVGSSVAQLRLLSLLLGCVAIYFGYLIARRWFGRQASWLAPTLMALSPLFLRYGTSMRMYTLALAIAFAATYVLLRAVENKSKKWWTAYGILVAAGMWTNYFIALVWTTHLLWLLYEYRAHEKIMKSWRRAFLLSLVLYLPWLPMLLFRYGEIQVSGFWIKPLSLDTLVSSITQSLVFRSASDTKAWLAVGVIVLIIALAFAGHKVYTKLTSDKKPAFRLVMAMSSLPVILLAIGSLPPLRSSYVYRYVLVASVAGALLTAIIVTLVKFKKRDTLLRSLLTALTVVILGSGALQVVVAGNRNLDTDSENKLSAVMDRVHHSGYPATVAV